MCNLNDHIREANVVSKSYLVPKDKINLAITDFLKEIAALKPKIVSLPFFSAQELIDGRFTIKLYQSLLHPIRNLPKGLHFDSYLLIEDMASLAVCGDAIEEQVAQGTDKILEYFKGHSLVAITPVFAILKGDDTLLYSVIKIGYARDS